MFRRIGVALLVAGVMAGCGGSSTPAPANGGGQGASPSPAGVAATPAGDAASPAVGGAGQAETSTVTLDGKEKTYPATCAVDGTIADGTIIVKVDGRDGADSASFAWLHSTLPTMPEASGVMDGVTWKAPDLNASISFASAHAWTFNGSDAETGKTVEGKVICN